MVCKSEVKGFLFFGVCAFWVFIFKCLGVFECVETCLGDGGPVSPMGCVLF
jgi:hypothetical protein